MIYDVVSLMVDSDLRGANPQFTLTCISTGGPATTVTWTRDSVPITEETETVLDDRVTAQYTHTLTVTGRLGGLYTCIVANDKPSKKSAHFTVEGIIMCLAYYYHNKHSIQLPLLPVTCIQSKYLPLLFWCLGVHLVMQLDTLSPTLEAVVAM